MRYIAGYLKNRLQSQFHTGTVGIAIIAIAGLLASSVLAQTVNYARPHEPPNKPAFLHLPLGTVKPAGWLRDWALAMRNGMVGNLESRSTVFSDTWKGPLTGGSDWPLEQCAQYLDGALRLACVLGDATFKAHIEARLDYVVNGVNNGGGSFIYWKSGVPTNAFASWAHGQMGRAIVAYYEESKKANVLSALVKAYQNYTGDGMGSIEFGQQVSSVGGIVNIDAMLEAYSYSGNSQVYNRALAAIKGNDWLIDQYSKNDTPFTVGHAVSTYEYARLPALFYPWTGEQRYLDASRNSMNWIEGQNLLPYGVTSGMEFSAGIGAFRLTETCNIGAALWTYTELYGISGDRRWGDIMESALFNAGHGSSTRNCDTLCYYQSPNRITATTLPAPQPNNPGEIGMKWTTLGDPQVLCCISYIPRALPSYIADMWKGTYDNGLAFTLYGPCTVAAKAGAGVDVNLTCNTNYPFGDSISIAVSPAQSASFPLYFRIPQWCSNPVIRVNGSSVSAPADAKGFAKVQRQWTSGDVVTLKFPMAPRVVTGYEKEYPSAVKDYFDFMPAAAFTPHQWPYASVYYGPVLYALPIPDLNSATPQAGANWKFALNVDKSLQGSDITPVIGTMPSTWNWPLASPFKLRVPVSAFNWNPGAYTALPTSTVTGTKDTTVDFVPYGCTYFRISMLPVTAKATAVMPGALRGQIQKQAGLNTMRMFLIDGRAVRLSASERNAAMFRSMHPGCYIVNAEGSRPSRMVIAR